jgi:hypothetical protein
MKSWRSCCLLLWENIRMLGWEVVILSFPLLQTEVHCGILSERMCSHEAMMMMMMGRASLLFSALDTLACT